jgi:PST family polysaccharide transporter
MLAGFLAGKFIAIYTGPSGISIVGIFQNLIAISQSISTAAMSTGIVKYTAEFEDEKKQNLLFSTSFKIFISASIVTTSLLFIFNKYIIEKLSLNEQYTLPVYLLGITTMFVSINSLFVSILNGKKQIKQFTIINAISSLIGLLCTLILVYYYNIKGAIYSLVLTQFLSTFFTFFLIRKFNWFRCKYFLNKTFDISIFKKLLHFSLMGVFSSVTIPIVQLIIRNIIVSKTSLEASGCWQGMSRISDSYLILVNTVLSAYYLPQLSSLETNLEIKHEITNGIKLIVPIVFISCFIIYIFRIQIIDIFFTKEFFVMEKLFFYQLIGDIIRVISWLMSYIILAKAMTKIFLFTETIFAISSVSLTYFFVDKYGIEGASIAFAINAFIYLLTILYFLRKPLFL